MEWQGKVLHRNSLLLADAPLVSNSFSKHDHNPSLFIRGQPF